MNKQNFTVGLSLTFVLVNVFYDNVWGSQLLQPYFSRLLLRTESFNDLSANISSIGAVSNKIDYKLVAPKLKLIYAHLFYFYF